MVEDGEKAALAAEGRWRATAPHVEGHRGYKLTSLSSTLPNASWPGLAAEFLQAKRSPTTLKPFINTVLGEPWRGEGDDLDDAELASLREPIGLDRLPPETLYLTGGADVQKDRIELTSIGWTADDEALVLAHEIVWGELRNFRLKMGRVAKGRFEERVQELADGNAMLQAAANPIPADRGALRRELAGLEKLLRDHAKSDPVCRQFMTLPGVGALVALTVKSAIDDPDRFRSSREVGPWVGLTPRREQSGERDIVGAISRAGDAGLRTVLYQAAMVMLNKGRPSWLTAWALNVAERRGKRRATVALARRIEVILHRMWRDGTEFRFSRAEAPTTSAA